MAKATEGEKAVALDYSMDRALMPLELIVTLCTATFGYRGRLLAVTPDHYIIGGVPSALSSAEGYYKLIDYGQMGEYSKGKNSNAANGEQWCEGCALVERSGNIAIEVSAAWQKKAK